jgi:hypothetical protein
MDEESNPVPVPSPDMARPQHVIDYYEPPNLQIHEGNL